MRSVEDADVCRVEGLAAADMQKQRQYMESEWSSAQRNAENVEREGKDVEMQKHAVQRESERPGPSHRLFFWESAERDWRPHRHLGSELGKKGGEVRLDLYVKTCPSRS